MVVIAKMLRRISSEKNVHRAKLGLVKKIVLVQPNMFNVFSMFQGEGG